MLVLSRKQSEKLILRSESTEVEIVVHVMRIAHGKVRIGIEAPADIKIVREEIDRKVTNEQA